jgi:hypothetical protein
MPVMFRINAESHITGHAERLCSQFATRRRIAELGQEAGFDWEGYGNVVERIFEQK